MSGFCICYNFERRWGGTSYLSGDSYCHIRRKITRRNHYVGVGQLLQQRLLWLIAEPQVRFVSPDVSRALWATTFVRVLSDLHATAAAMHVRLISVSQGLRALRKMCSMGRTHFNRGSLECSTLSTRLVAMHRTGTSLTCQSTAGSE